MALFLAPLALAVALQGQVTIGIGKKPNADSSAARRAAIEAIIEEARADTTRRRQRTPRHITMTPTHLATAFKDPVAKELVERARDAAQRENPALARPRAS